MNGRFLCVCVVAVLSLVASGPNSVLFAQDANTILALRGRWAGTAILTPDSGPTQSYDCVATYFPSSDGASVRQNLRCKSPDYQFDGATELQIAAGKITGRWQDKINNWDGIVSGKVRPDGLDILLSGIFFDAKMTVVTSACQQSIRIVLEEGLPVKTVAATLRKC